MTAAIEAGAPLSGRARSFAFLYHTSALIALFAASSAPTPLYRFYQQLWRFSPGTLTLIFAMYAVCLLAALLFVGSLSDHVGRRPVIAAALVAETLAMAIFATTGGVTSLLVARAVQGFATGAAASAIGAALIDIDGKEGAVINGVAPLLGMALGALGTSFLIAYVPWPMVFVFVLLLAVFALQFAGSFLVPDISIRRPGALASLLPRIVIPRAARRPLLGVTPLNIAVWALGGFFLSLIPSLAREVTGLSSPVVGGFLVSALTISGSLAVVSLRRHEPRRILAFGMTTFILGLTVLEAGVAAGSSALLVAGTIVAGLGHGSSFLGSLASVVPHADAKERAGLLAAIYIESYLAFSIPAVLAGFAAARFGLVTASYFYGSALIALAAVAIFTTRRMVSKDAGASDLR